MSFENNSSDYDKILNKRLYVIIGPEEKTVTLDEVRSCTTGKFKNLSRLWLYLKKGINLSESRLGGLLLNEKNREVLEEVNALMAKINYSKLSQGIESNTHVKEILVKRAENLNHINELMLRVLEQPRFKEIKDGVNRKTVNENLSKGELQAPKEEWAAKYKKLEELRGHTNEAHEVTNKLRIFAKLSQDPFKVIRLPNHPLYAKFSEFVLKKQSNSRSFIPVNAEHLKKLYQEFATTLTASDLKALIKSTEEQDKDVIWADQQANLAALDMGPTNQEPINRFNKAISDKKSLLIDAYIKKHFSSPYEMLNNPDSLIYNNFVTYAALNKLEISEANLVENYNKFLEKLKSLFSLDELRAKARDFEQSELFVDLLEDQLVALNAKIKEG